MVFRIFNNLYSVGRKDAGIQHSGWTHPKCLEHGLAEARGEAVGRERDQGGGSLPMNTETFQHLDKQHAFVSLQQLPGFVFSPSETSKLRPREAIGHPATKQLSQDLDPRLLAPQPKHLPAHQLLEHQEELPWSGRRVGGACS